MSGNLAFSFVSIDQRRSVSKPRQSGLTMVFDYQLGLKALEELLVVAGDYFDIFKIATGTSRLFDRDHLMQKIQLLHQHQVRVLLGGQFQEYILHTMGVEVFPQHLQEAAALGFDLVEISDNIVSLDPALRQQLVADIKAAGMAAVCEIGNKQSQTDSQQMLEQIQAALNLGAEFVMIEGNELMVDGSPNEELIQTLKENVDTDRCMFELATPRVGNTIAEIYAGKKFLVKTFGPDINLGNVAADLVIETETVRLGLGSAGPLDLMI